MADGSDFTLFPITNARGDVVEVRLSNGNLYARYIYDSWGNIVSVRNPNGYEIADPNHYAHQNPFRYRGYYYDAESGLYYLQSRYYDPVTGRFVNADDTSVLGESPMDVTDKNLYSYCDNNPVNRDDNSGKLWGFVAKAFVGCITQYISDVVRNVASGERGLKVFKPSSSLGTYVAAGVTAVIPGKGVVSSVVKNTVTEGIKYIEKRAKGEQQSAKETVSNIVKGVALDVTVSVATKAVTNKISSLAPKNYSSYAGKQYKKSPDITREQIELKMANIGKTIGLANSASTFAFDVIKTTISDAV